MSVDRFHAALEGFVRFKEAAERAACVINGVFERWLYTDAQYIALVWLTIERTWPATLWAWMRGTP